MSEAGKLLTDAYYWLSMYKAGAVPEDLALEQVKGALLDQPQLNENQLIVLKWLKDKYTITDIEPIELFWRLHVNTKNKFRTLLAYRAYKSLTRKAQLEVLQVFSQWALEQEEE
ncbi:hypothetical protein FQS90_09560 [Enterococcus casseliflavus]|uniref:hypothetical protein n=1 Tax=Enterococcus sp. 8E11_MSG4843 TaxID=1834190 RepID=UPI000B6462E1|nr:hypothetical protein [Enterococcus sp. 8E11_MSG4843]MBO1096769.1 hypothetical protein [Enterococcus casseliflavus]MBO1145091.1 hypothetical protein [Enterococcus casseliflavus]OUZ36769.1 hypothetical protein A5885_000958 [Enterococcus sp. 8E11_MSG4843]